MFINFNAIQGISSCYYSLVFYIRATRSPEHRGEVRGVDARTRAEYSEVRRKVLNARFWTEYSVPSEYSGGGGERGVREKSIESVRIMFHDFFLISF